MLIGDFCNYGFSRRQFSASARVGRDWPSFPPARASHFHVRKYRGNFLPECSRVPRLSRPRPSTSRWAGWNIPSTGSAVITLVLAMIRKEQFQRYGLAAA